MRPLLLRCALFVAVFAGLQSLWGAARGTSVDRLWIEQLTVRPAAALVRRLTPGVEARPEGARIAAPGGGLNVRNGCDGTEMLFLLAAAVAVAPLSLRTRAGALASGLLLVLALNQARILVLFYAYRADLALFDLLHTIVAPLVLVALIGAFFQCWLLGTRRSSAASA